MAYSELEDWDDLLLLTGQVNYDHLLVIISARRGSISYDSAFERLPMQISKYFNNNSIMLLYPEQKGDPNESLSFSDPRGWLKHNIMIRWATGSINGLKRIHERR